MNDNESLRIMTRLIVAQDETSKTVRSLAAELTQDRVAISGLAHEVHGLTAEMRTEREERKRGHEEQEKEIRRIDRVATEAARRVVVRWFPMVGVVGAGAAWLLKEGPGIWMSWQSMFP